MKRIRSVFRTVWHYLTLPVVTVAYALQEKQGRKR